MSWSSDSSRIPPEQQIRDSLIRSLDANGATPSRFLDLLDAVTQPSSPGDDSAAWRKLQNRHGRPFRKFIDFVTTERPEGLGLHGRDDLTKHLALQHKEEREPFRRQAAVDRMAAMRERVAKLLGDDLVEAMPERTPGPGRGVKTMSYTHSFVPQDTHTADAIIARLKRDAAHNPAAADLAAKVLNGKVKPHKAAREMGWRKPRIVLSTPERVAERLRDHFRDPGQRTLLAELLTKED